MYMYTYIHQYYIEYFFVETKQLFSLCPATMLVCKRKKQLDGARERKRAVKTCCRCRETAQIKAGY